MAMRSPAGFISAFFDPLKNPNSPTSPVATGGDSSASVAFTAPGNVGGSAITAYYAVANDGTTSSAASSPVTVSGLTNGTSYTFNVWALNSYGPSVFSATTNSVTPALSRAINNGGTAAQGNYVYFNMSSTGNSTTFGGLLYDRAQFAGLSSATRGVFAGGNGAESNMEYITIATTGNAVSFGSLGADFFQFAGAANSTRGIWFLANQSAMTSLISYITIATTGATTFFGNSTNLIRGNGAGANSTRALCALGLVDGVGQVNTVQYVTIATTGNASFFGQLTTSERYKTAGFSSSTRVFFAGGGGSSASSFNVIDYFTVATTGNATDFGDLNEGLNAPAATSSSVYGFVIGGHTDSGLATKTSTIRYITMSSSGNSSTWGQLSTTQQDSEACSSAHGGLS